MTKIYESFKLSAEQKAKIDKILAKGDEKYADVAHIICERALTDEEYTSLMTDLEDDVKK